MHLASSRRRQRSDEKVAESGTGVCATTFPSAYHVLTLGNKVSRSPEIQVRKCFAEPCHERLDVLAAATRFVERILQQHVGRCEFVDYFEIAVLAPEFGEPATDDSLVVDFLTHFSLLSSPLLDFQMNLEQRSGHLVRA